VTEKVAFSLRLRPRDYESLRAWAFLQRTTIAGQAEGFVVEGLRKALDPVEIERMAERNKREMLAACAALARESDSTAGDSGEDCP
jgi:hypothetical protein